MNQKEYNTIAKILHEMRGKFFGIRERQIFDGYMKELADYFEREGFTSLNKICIDCYNKSGHETLLCNCPCHKGKFNREQFLKDCGVE